VSGISLIVALALAGPGAARERRPEGRWWRRACHDRFLGGPCEVKIEAERDEYEEVIKCE
jgi:hypothetical protein